MAEEVHMDPEAALRRADKAAALPWSPLDPLAALMAKEDPEVAGMERDEVWERLLGFLFADGDPRCWENVAERALALMRHCVTGMLCGRDLGEVAGIRARSKLKQSYWLTEFAEGCEDEEFQTMLRGMLGYLFPGDDEEWLKEGCRRAYLVVRAFRPEYVTIYKEVRRPVKVKGKDERGRMCVGRVMRGTMEAAEANYEALAGIFGEAVASAEDKKRARARWSARAQRVITQVVEAGGGKVRLQFGKSSEAREKMKAAAEGNTSRKGNAA